MDAAQHLEALAGAHEEVLRSIAHAAAAAHAQIDGDMETLGQLLGTTRPPLIADVPVEEPPPYVPPAPSMTSHNALIPDTPLVDSPLSHSSLAFDDSPLWQS